VSSGFNDKLYWRRVAPNSIYHCFKKVEGGGFISLCRKHWIERSGGQAIDRPRSEFRCGLCDGKEMERRGWEESGPERLNLHPRS
jgi:hypothetical protein